MLARIQCQEELKVKLAEKKVKGKIRNEVISANENVALAFGSLARIFNGLDELPSCYADLVKKYDQFSGKEQAWWVQFLKITYDNFYEADGRLQSWVIDALGPEFKTLMQDTLQDDVLAHTVVMTSLRERVAGVVMSNQFQVGLKAKGKTEDERFDMAKALSDKCTAHSNQFVRQAEPFLNSKYSVLDSLRKMLEKKEVKADPAVKKEIEKLMRLIQFSFDPKEGAEHLKFLNEARYKLERLGQPALGFDIFKLRACYKEHHLAVITSVKENVGVLQRETETLLDELKALKSEAADTCAEKLIQLIERIEMVSVELKDVAENRLTSKQLHGEKAMILHDYLTGLLSGLYGEYIAILSSMDRVIPSSAGKFSHRGVTFFEKKPEEDQGAKVWVALKVAEGFLSDFLHRQGIPDMSKKLAKKHKIEEMKKRFKQGENVVLYRSDIREVRSSQAAILQTIVEMASDTREIKKDIEVKEKIIFNGRKKESNFFNDADEEKFLEGTVDNVKKIRQTIKKCLCQIDLLKKNIDLFEKAIEERYGQGVKAILSDPEIYIVDHGTGKASIELKAKVNQLEVHGSVKTDPEAFAHVIVRLNLEVVEGQSVKALATHEQHFQEGRIADAMSRASKSEPRRGSGGGAPPVLSPH